MSSAPSQPAQTGAGKTVLVTGGSGYVAAHVLNSFLSRGYNVRTTVRTQATAEKVKKSHKQYLDRLSFAIVGDVATPGAHDEAVRGVDGVIHTASPFVSLPLFWHCGFERKLSLGSGSRQDFTQRPKSKQKLTYLQQMQVQDNKRDLLDPAINGTTSVLTSIQKHNPLLKRVVITSSFAAIDDLNLGARPGYTYTESDWNPITYQEAADPNAAGAVAYCASKTFAERAAFDFVENNKPNFNVTTLCPPMVYGPAAHSVESLKGLNTSSADIYRLINGSEKTVPDTAFFAFVDVRDLGEAHVLAFESERAAGQRYIVAAGGYTYQAICDVLREEFPELRERVPEGKVGSGIAYPDVYRVDNGKIGRELGLEFRGLRETVGDMVKGFLEIEGRVEA